MSKIPSPLHIHKLKAYLASDIGSVALTQCQSVSTFESEVQNSLSMLEPHSTDSLGH